MNHDVVMGIAGFFTGVAFWLPVFAMLADLFHGETRKNPTEDR